MKKLLVPFLIIATLLTFIKIGFALSGSVTTPNIKQLLVDGDMEMTNPTVPLVDGDMEADLYGPWSVNNPGTFTKEGNAYQGTRCLRATNSVGQGAGLLQTPVTAGRTYKITGAFRGDGQGVSYPRVRLSTAITISGTNSNTWQTFTATGVVNNTYLVLDTLGATGYAEFDDITITDVSAGVWPPYDANTLVSKTTTNPHSGRQAIRSTRLANGGYTGMTQTILTVGKRYHVTGFARGSGGTDIPWIAVGGYSNDWTGTNSTSWQRFDFTIDADGTVLFFLAVNGAINDYVEYDDVFVTEVTGYTQVQDKQTLVDGDMEGLPVALADAAMEAAGVASWPVIVGCTRAKGTTDPHSGAQFIRVTYDTGAVSYIGQYPLTVGNTYRVTGWARGDSTNIPDLGINGNYQHIATNSTNWQRFEVVFTSTITRAAFGSQAMSVGGYVDFDDISIVDIGATAWLVYQAVPSKQTTSPHGGNQVIRVAFDGTNTDGLIYQTVLTLGKRYHVTGWMRGDGTSIPLVAVGNANFRSGTASASWQRFDFIETDTIDTNFRLQSSSLSATHYVEYDDIEVTEYKGQVQVINKQILADGDMEGLPVALADAAMEAAGTGSWSGGGSETKAKVAGNLSGAGSQYLRITQTAPSPLVYQTVLTSGHTYHVTGWARGDGTANPKVSANDSSLLWTGTNSASSQYFDYIATNTGTQLRLWCMNGGNGNYCDFDDISVVDIGTSAWTPGSSNATLTKSTASPHSGKYALRAAWGSGTYVYASGGAIFTPGKKYRMTGWVRSDGTVTPTVSISGGYSVWIGTTATSWQKIDVTFTPLYNSLYLLYQASSPAWVEWDDLYATLAE